MATLCVAPLSLWVVIILNNKQQQLLIERDRHMQRYGTNPRKVINYRQVEKNILDEILGAAVYDTRLRPPGRNKSVTATLVYVNIFVRDFSAISDVSMVGQYDRSKNAGQMIGIRLLHHSATAVE